MKLIAVITIVAALQGVSADPKVNSGKNLQASGNQVTEEIITEQIRDLREKAKKLEENMLDFSDPNDVVTSDATARIRRFREEVEKFEPYMTDFLKSYEHTDSEEKDTGHASCDDGLIYECKCYFFVTFGGPFSQAQSECTSRGGTVAELWNGEHQHLVEDYVRSRTAVAHLWLANTYKVGEDVIYYSDGDPVSKTAQDSFSWNVRLPDAAYNQLVLMIYIDGTPMNNGLFNAPTWLAQLTGALCVK